MEIISAVKIAVFGCDVYSDCAPAYLYLHRKNWPDCPYPIEFVTNKKKLRVDVPVHYLGYRDINFGSRLRDYVKNRFRDPDGLMLFMMIDYFEIEVDHPLVERAVELCKREDISYVRLRHMPPPKVIYEPDSDFGILDKKARYALSLQPGIWDAQLLHDLLREGETPWKAEVFGSRRVCGRGGLFLSTCTFYPAITHYNFIRRGTAQHWAVVWVRQNVPSEFWPEACEQR